jgi:hypothetical protein
VCSFNLARPSAKRPVSTLSLLRCAYVGYRHDFISNYSCSIWVIFFVALTARPVYLKKDTIELLLYRPKLNCNNNSSFLCPCHNLYGVGTAFLLLPFSSISRHLITYIYISHILSHRVNPSFLDCSHSCSSLL